jgi:hypothetical protein
VTIEGAPGPSDAWRSCRSARRHPGSVRRRRPDGIRAHGRPSDDPLLQRGSEEAQRARLRHPGAAGASVLDDADRDHGDADRPDRQPVRQSATPHLQLADPRGTDHEERRGLPGGARPLQVLPRVRPVGEHGGGTARSVSRRGAGKDRRADPLQSHSQAGRGRQLLRGQERDRLACYRISRSRSKQIVGLDQFGVQTRRVRNADLLCAPTAKLAWDRVG